MITGMRHGSLLHPLSVDPTFNHGEFEVTPFTFRSHIFDSKSKNITAKYVKATLPGPVVLHHGKKENIFTLAFKVIAEKTGLTDTVFGIITDGELAVQNACSANFKNSLLLRCANNHFKENCKRFLLSAGVPNNDLHVFLEVVFGEEGLLEAEDKKDLKRRIKTAEDFLMGMENAVSNSIQEKFCDFIKKREKPVIRKMIRDVRQRANLPLDDNSVPVRSYTNQSETLNFMLSAKKESINFGKKKDLSKSQFIRDVWFSLIEEINEELQKAVYDQSDRYRLSESAEYLTVAIDEWYNWNNEQNI